MAIKNFNIIGERINPGFRSSLALFESENIEGIAALALDQVEKGAVALNINIGDKARSNPHFMAEVIKAVQDVVSVPLSFDFPNYEVQEICLKSYSEEKSKGAKPIINSISELRYEMLDLLSIRPCKILLMASERVEGGEKIANKKADEVHDTAVKMVERVLTHSSDLSKDDLYIDVSIGPVAADTEGLIKMAIDAIKLIGEDSRLQGTHMSVGLSNVSVMLPKFAVDGTLLKEQIDSAFLTMTVPYGLDYSLASAGRNYRLLSEDNIVLQGFKEAVEMGGFESLMRIRELYTKSA